MKIVVFNHSFFLLSETFIYRQVIGLPANIGAALLSFNFENDHLYPTGNKKIALTHPPGIINRIIKQVLPSINKLGFDLFNYTRVKKILLKEQPDAIHAHFGFNAETIFPLAKKLNIPLIVSFHGVDASPQMLKKDSYKKLMQEIVEYSAAVIVCSPHMIDTLDISQYIDKIHLIPYGVDTLEFTKQSVLGKDERLTILHSGRLVEKKGVPDLIRAFANISKKKNNIRLVIIGDGPELAHSKEIAAASGASNIEFLGAQPQSVVKKYMSLADIFVLNSRTSDAGDMEGLPNAILEAMSMELPVISTYHAGIAQAITDSANGMLVAERDNVALESKLEQLIGDSSLRAALGNAARKTIEKNFTIDGMNKKIAKVYDSRFK